MARPDEDGKIECTGCERRLPGDPEHFHRHRDAFKPKCKECRGSSFGIHHVNKVLDAKEGHKFCSKCHRELPKDRTHFMQSPKTDGWTPDCKECRGFEFGENRSYVNEDGTRYCATCSRDLPNDEEHFFKNSTECKECKGHEFGVKRPNRVYDVPDGKKYCGGCNELLEATTENFYKIESGLINICKRCKSERGREWRQNNPEKVREMAREYRHSPRGRAAQARKKARRRDRLESGNHTLTAGQWMQLKAAWSYQCAYCGCEPDELERDHVVPVVDGGDTDYENIVPVCSTCNKRKGGERLEDWYPEREFYDPQRAQKIDQHTHDGVQCSDGGVRGSD